MASLYKRTRILRCAITLILFFFFFRVANHMGYPTTPGDYSNFVPFNKPEYYHTACDINWSDQGSVKQNDYYDILIILLSM